MHSSFVPPTLLVSFVVVMLNEFDNHNFMIIYNYFKLKLLKGYALFFQCTSLKQIGNMIRKCEELKIQETTILYEEIDDNSFSLPIPDRESCIRVYMYVCKNR